MRNLIVAGLVVAAATVPATAMAQTTDPPAATVQSAGAQEPAPTTPVNPYDRNGGLLIGFSLGAGWSGQSCDLCDGAGGLAVDASVGWFVTRRFALMLDVFVVTTAEGEELTSTGNAMSAFALQYWLTPRLWLKGGVGYNSLIVATPFGAGRAGGGGMSLGFGYELYQSGGSFALDVHGRASHGEVSVLDIGVDNLAVLMGLSWH